MVILVTGATGFVGRHLVSELLNRGHKIIATSRDEEKAKRAPWFSEVQYFPMDLSNFEKALAKLSVLPDALIHLAWQGLPNYDALFHLEENFPQSYYLIKHIVEAGVKQILVTGTCFEYGLQYGQLSEHSLTQPVTAYGVAKDTLRKFLQELQKKIPFVLQWVRLFYLYGEGQNPNSLLEQLNRSIENGDEYFHMSHGEQLRDYLHIKEVARRLAILIEHPEVNGIINCCSGEPISVRRFVEERLKERNASIKLRLGHKPYPDYEPLAFWGDPSRINEILKKYE